MALQVTLSTDPGGALRGFSSPSENKPVLKGVYEAPCTQVLAAPVTSCPDTPAPWLQPHSAQGLLTCRLCLEHRVPTYHRPASQSVSSLQKFPIQGVFCLTQHLARSPTGSIPYPELRRRAHGLAPTALFIACCPSWGRNCALFTLVHTVFQIVSDGVSAS